MKWADLCPSSVLSLFILSSWGPTVAFTSIFTYTIPASLKLDMSYKQTIRLWGWDRDRQKVWGIAKLESMYVLKNVRDDKFVQVCEGLDGIRDVDYGDSTCWSSTETVIIIITVFFPSLLPCKRGLILLCVMDCMQRVHHFQVQTACGLNAWNCVRWTVQYPQEYLQICVCRELRSVCRLAAVSMITKVPVVWFIYVWFAQLMRNGSKKQKTAYNVHVSVWCASVWWLRRQICEWVTANLQFVCNRRPENAPVLNDAIDKSVGWKVFVASGSFRSLIDKSRWMFTEGPSSK